MYLIGVSVDDTDHVIGGATTQNAVLTEPLSAVQLQQTTRSQAVATIADRTASQQTT